MVGVGGAKVRIRVGRRAQPWLCPSNGPPPPSGRGFADRGLGPRLVSLPCRASFPKADLSAPLGPAGLVGAVIGVGMVGRLLGEDSELNALMLKKIVVGWAATIPLAMIISVLVFKGTIYSYQGAECS